MVEEAQERKLYKAASDGDVTTLVELVQDDILFMDSHFHVQETFYI